MPKRRAPWPHASDRTLQLALAMLATACGVVDRDGDSQQQSSQPVRTSFFRAEAREQAFIELGRLREIQARHLDRMRSHAGVKSMGIGLDHATGKLNFLVVIAPEQRPAPSFGPIEGVTVQTLALPDPTPSHGGAACQPCHDDKFALPVEMGNSAYTEARSAPGGCFAGTCSLGFKACDLDTARFVYVTAAHCGTATSSVCAGSAGFGAPTYHRASLDANSCTPEDQVGTIVEEVPPTCGIGNTIEATSVESDSSQTQFSIRDIGVPSAFPGAVLPGDFVQKSGRTTGHTFGVVGAVGMPVSVSDPSYCGCATTDFVDQLLILPDPPGTDFAIIGDSGSAVLDLGSPPAIVGLNILGITSGWFAGSSYANAVGNLLGTLDLSLNQLDCLDPCAALLASGSTDDPRRALRAAADFRDYRLTQSERGRRYIDLFYDFTGELVRMMLARPSLLRDTARLFERSVPIIEQVTAGRRVTVAREQIEAVAALFSQYAAAATQPELQAALAELALDLRNPQVLREFGVQIAQPAIAP